VDWQHRDRRQAGLSAMNGLEAPVRLHYEVELGYQVNSSGSDFIFNLQAARTRHQTVLQESLYVDQPVASQEYVDPVTAARVLRLRANTGPLWIAYKATVDITHHHEQPASLVETWIPYLPGPVLPYLYPSRFCQSDLLASFAMREFGHLWQGYSRVQAICEWAQRNIAFVSGSSNSTTTASDTLTRREGVCRDFAHVMISLCRALNIPARFTTGLDYGADPALGPTDFHAYVEVFLGNRWYLFDPSGTAIPMGFVRLSSGRDAADCAYASIFGTVMPTTRRLQIDTVAGIDGVVRTPFHCSEALSTDQP
jgi:transglutaminase-like putative cysteine protease